MPRAIAAAQISFGLVAIPVKLFSAAESSEKITFNMLHQECGNRIQQQLFCPKDERTVERSEVVKGYEFSKGQYVLFNPEELKALDEKATNSIDIAEFVPLPKVERIYVDKIYYLGPDKGGERAYRLLSEALKETNRAAVGQYAARGQQNLVLVRPMDGVLVMEQLHYADEIRPASEVPIGEGEVKKSELALAKQLIEQTSTEEFKPENYRDNVKDRVLEAIHKKVDGQEITAEPAPEQGAKIIDLMEALKASLGKEKADRKPAKRATEEKPVRVAKVAKGGR